MKFEWDENKNQSNIKKHGFDFIDAQEVFEGIHLTAPCREIEKYGEKRFITLGKCHGYFAVVVHTPRKNTTRIISMRKANVKEKKGFKNRLEAD